MKVLEPLPTKPAPQIRMEATYDALARFAAAATDPGIIVGGLGAEAQAGQLLLADLGKIFKPGEFEQDRRLIAAMVIYDRSGPVRRLNSEDRVVG